MPLPTMTPLPSPNTAQRAIALLSLMLLASCGGGDAPSTGTTREKSQAATTTLAVPIVAEADPMLTGLTIPADAPTRGMWSATQPWPMNGLHAVLLPNGKVLVVARGRFDAAKIASFARTSGVKTQSYAGVDVLTPDGATHNGAKKEGWLAVLDNSTALAGDQELVKAAIDRRKQSNGGQLSQVTANKITDLSLRYDAWMISTSLARLADDFKSPQVGGAMNGNFIQGMENVMGGVRFGANVELMAEATMRSDKDAQALVDVVKFLTGMMQLNSEDKKAAEFARLTEKMDLKAVGTQFKMSMMIPEDVLEGILKPAARIVRKKNAPVI